MRIPGKKFGSIFLSFFKVPATLVVVGVLIFGFLCTGIFHKGPMNMSSMDMGAVSSQQEQQCCNLGSAHQFDSWRSVILVTPDNTRNSLILLALGLALILGYSLSSFWNRKPQFEPDIGRLYIKENPDLILFNHLRLAFARGILNPKVF
jgi:hypothetical protein